MNEMWVGFAVTIGTVVFCTGLVYGKLIGELRLMKYRLNAIEGALRTLGFKFPHAEPKADI